MTMLLEHANHPIPLGVLEGDVAKPLDLPVFDESMLECENSIRVARWRHGEFSLRVKVEFDDTTTHDEYESNLTPDRSNPRHDTWEITGNAEVRLPRTYQGNTYLMTMDETPFEILNGLLEQGLTITDACQTTMKTVASRAASVMEWLNDEWSYVSVEVRIKKGKEIVLDDSCIGVEDKDDYVEAFVNGVIHDYFC
jgi:hypothetical protein